MRLIGIEDIGFISLFQSIITIISFLQIGLLNGGYRIISRSDTALKRINNFVYSYHIFFLILILTVIVPLSYYFNFTTDLFLIFYAVLIGILSILSNWNTNILLAQQKIHLLNKLSLGSLAASFLALFLMNYSAIWAGLLMTTFQIVVFVIASSIAGDYRFKLVKLDKRTFIYLMRVGFVPYLIGIIGTLFVILEKWVITSDMGVESLGEYYLVGIYSVFFLLAPSALNNLLFPAALKTKVKFANIYLSFYKSYFLQLSVYIFFAGMLTYFAADDLIEYFLPNYLSSVKLIKIVFWGLAFITISQPFLLITQLKLEYRKMIIVYVYSIILVSILYFISSFKHSKSLETYAYINSFFNIFVALNFVFLYFADKRIFNE